MDLSKFTNVIGEAARPASIYTLALALAVSLFFPMISNGAQTIVAGVISVLVGARSYENTVTTKGDNEVKKAAVAVGASVTTVSGTPPAVGAQTIEGKKI